MGTFDPLRRQVEARKRLLESIFNDSSLSDDEVRRRLREELPSTSPEEIDRLVEQRSK